MMDLIMWVLLLFAIYLVCASAYTYGRVKEREAQVPAVLPEAVPESEVVRKLREDILSLGYQNVRLSEENRRLASTKYTSGKAVINHGEQHRPRRRHPLS